MQRFKLFKMQVKESVFSLYKPASFFYTLFRFDVTIAPIKNTDLINVKYNNTINGTISRSEVQID